MERRKSPRVPIEVEFQLWKDDKIEKKSKGVIININIEGMCIETDLSSPVGTDLVFSLDALGEFKFNIYGKIVWQEKSGDIIKYGTQFTRLDVTKKPDLYKFILVTMCLNGEKK
ncbi:MAG: PilZ domain-containing protein [Candidatus Aminicenantes bacterium]|nr:PilZ domain-containing protein [Candidatus Aminicenantes bacterium]